MLSGSRQTCRQGLGLALHKARSFTEHTATAHASFLGTPNPSLLSCRLCRLALLQTPRRTTFQVRCAGWGGVGRGGVERGSKVHHKGSSPAGTSPYRVRAGWGRARRGRDVLHAHGLHPIRHSITPAALSATHTHTPQAMYGTRMLVVYL